MVPFGKSSRCGLVVELDRHSQLPQDRLKRVDKILDPKPLLQDWDLHFLHWVADYYQHPLGDVIFHALPVRLRKGQLPAQLKSKAWRLSHTGRQIDLSTIKRAPRQLSILEALKGCPDGLRQSEIMRRCGECSAVLRTLQHKQWIEPIQMDLPRGKIQQHSTPPRLNPAQTEAVNRFGSRLGRFHAALLNGVTGSGKTEVYLSLIEAVCKQGGQVLVLVPEIGLTPQLVRRFEKRLGMAVALLHSNLAEGERARAWLAASQGKEQLLVGTRSAIFTPLPKLSLIIVDEEHDLSFKQQEGFRYNARDLAILRAQRQSCPVLLGSATPSLESLQNARQGRYDLIRLPERVGSARLPSISLLDIRSSRLDGGLSPVLLKQINRTLQYGEQVMLFLNRRGYAPVITCHACGWLADCPRCDARMTLHLQKRLLWCHHCGHQHPIPAQCPSCGCPDLRPLGQGTERLENALQQHFSSTPLARIDRDSTSRKGSLQRLLESIRSGDYRLIIGTQMLAKGHHFPNVTLVGLIDVDQGLFGADYRAPERMAQLIIQVAGRAGRADKPGQVLIQTRHPDHPLLLTLVQQGYDAFAKQALEERRLANLPPFSYQILLRAESTRPEEPVKFLTQAATEGKTLPFATGLEFWGPVPAPMERKAGKVRAHLLVQTANRGQLQRWLGEWVNRLTQLPAGRRVRWSLDVDPQEML